MLSRLRLRSLSTLWVAVALFSGMLSSGLWFVSTQNWSLHLSQADAAGIEVYYALESGQPVDGIEISTLSAVDSDHAVAGQFDRITGTPTPAYVTLLSLGDSKGDDPTKISGVQIAVVSDRLKYRVAEISNGKIHAPALKFGELTRLLATYCSNPILFAHTRAGPWMRVDGTGVWGCAAAPSDYRLPAAFLAILTLAVLVTLIGNTTDAFDTFSRQLRSRKHQGGPDAYETKGPKELHEIVKSVNSYLEEQRSQLSKRAIVLSGVSHDLGTPATRLRLRAALIDDVQMREKIEADIDQMTGIIESVLTYTRSELNSENPRKLSLTSLVEAVVADYIDTGHPVILEEALPVSVKTDRSVFASRSGSVALNDPKKLLIFARPIALRRAISNLIDNALKYGRRASVSLEADANWAIVTIEDEGGQGSASDMETLLDPFERGKGAESVSGFGLGLTIVATVARQHGGRIEFEDGRMGVRARLWLARS